MELVPPPLLFRLIYGVWGQHSFTLPLADCPSSRSERETTENSCEPLAHRVRKLLDFLPPSLSSFPLLSYHPPSLPPARFRIISKKESGVISGWQIEPTGPIMYSKTLPKDTQISL